MIRRLLLPRTATLQEDTLSSLWQPHYERDQTPAGPEVGKITDLRVGGWENHRPPGAKVGDFPSPLRGAVFRPWIRFHMFSYVFMLSGPEGEAMGGLSNLERRSPIHPYPFQNLSDGHNMAI